MRGGDANRWTRLRAAVLGALILSAFAGVMARAAQVQLFDRARLSRKARAQTRREVELAPRRGLIADRRGEPLALTQDVDSIFADPSAFKSDAERAAAAGKLGRALRSDRRRTAKKLQRQGQFVWLKRRVEPAAAARVRALGIDGVEIVKEPKRFYPQSELAGHVLGFVGEEGGMEGVERELDAHLRGRPVTVAAVRDARGATAWERGPDPTQLTGATVTLTLDGAIQLATERELQKAVEETRAAAGWAVVMDVRSGGILALASSPSFDANQPGRDPEVWRNRAVQDALEPGSTIKSFVVAAALESGALQPGTQLFCENGSWRRGRKTIHDTHKVGWATPAVVLRESSNICAAKIGELLGKERLVAGLRAFGFGERTGVGLPGEARGSLRAAAVLKPIEADTISFGQGMSATAIQSVAAMAAIANGGTLLRPYLVEKVVAPDGRVLLTRGRAEVRRVLSPRTARLVAGMLEEVTRRGGSGTKAAIADFRVAGKTGTAQKVDLVNGGYGAGRLASFLGFVPAEAPRVAILVSIDEPEGKRVFGGDVAAPAWAAIAAETLRQLDVHPQRVRERAIALPTPAAEPEAAGRRPKAASAGRSIVPDLTGLAARSAIRRLAESELEPELRGSGLAVAQDPRAGAVVRRGARVRVTLAPPEAG